jgi:DNA-binding transcriptional regulator YdaS (Cro superfamily)
MDRFDEWIRRLGPVKAARLLNDLYRGESTISYQSVQGWLKRRVPAERVLAVERVSGIDRKDIRPDLYPA